MRPRISPNHEDRRIAHPAELAAEVPLSDLIDLTKDGEWGTSEPTVDSLEVAVIRGTDFGAASRGLVSELPVRHIASRHVATKRLRANDIIIETAGGSKNRPTGRTLFVRDELLERCRRPVVCASFCRFIRVDEGKAEPAYVYWCLQALYRSGRMNAFNTQHTGLSRFQWTDFASSTRLSLPSTRSQRRAAVLLSAFDELIEINERRIELFGDLARSLYREWFVRYRFPGHMDAQFVESEWGLIPAGWEATFLGDVLTLSYGKALPARSRRPGTVPVVSSAGVIDTHDEALVRGPGIVVGRKGNVGSVWWIDDDFFPIDTTYYVTSDQPLGFLYWQLSGLRFIDSHAAVPGLSRDQATTLRVLRPDEATSHRFDAINGALFAEIAALRSQIRSLADARGLLLPRLVTGRLDISDVELGDLLPSEPT